MQNEFHNSEQHKQCSESPFSCEAQERFALRQMLRVPRKAFRDSFTSYSVHDCLFYVYVTHLRAKEEKRSIWFYLLTYSLHGAEPFLRS